MISRNVNLWLKEHFVQFFCKDQLCEFDNKIVQTCGDLKWKFCGLVTIYFYGYFILQNFSYRVIKI